MTKTDRPPMDRLDIACLLGNWPNAVAELVARTRALEARVRALEEKERPTTMAERPSLSSLDAATFAHPALFVEAEATPPKWDLPTP